MRGSRILAVGCVHCSSDVPGRWSFDVWQLEGLAVIRCESAVRLRRKAGDSVGIESG